MSLKRILKSLRLHESTISMILGAIVIVVLGVIVVNYFRGQQVGQLPESTPATTGTGQPRVTRGEGPVTYTVAEGENLWEIAEMQYNSGYNWIDIAEANELSNPNELAVGMELTIPDVEPRQLTVSEEAEEIAETEDTQLEDVSDPVSGATYTVERGDTLWNIAVRAYGDGYRWVDIAEENNLANPNLIHQGNVLTIPR